ncbi:MAG: hypothetical protein H7A25_10555 [Leptospiraceae bacterium]|nr:hypothetical protein [Leptospiraceae bacterium]
MNTQKFLKHPRIWNKKIYFNQKKYSFFNRDYNGFPDITNDLYEEHGIQVHPENYYEFVQVLQDEVLAIEKESGLLERMISKSLRIFINSFKIGYYDNFYFYPPKTLHSEDESLYGSLMYDEEKVFTSDNIKGLNIELKNIFKIKSDWKEFPRNLKTPKNILKIKRIILHSFIENIFQDMLYFYSESYDFFGKWQERGLTFIDIDPMMWSVDYVLYHVSSSNNCISSDVLAALDEVLEDKYSYQRARLLEESPLSLELVLGPIREGMSHASMKYLIRSSLSKYYYMEAKDLIWKWKSRGVEFVDDTLLHHDTKYSFIDYITGDDLMINNIYTAVDNVLENKYETQKELFIESSPYDLNPLLKNILNNETIDCWNIDELEKEVNLFLLENYEL